MTAISASISELLSKTSGRDKTCRLIQYLMRFLAARSRRMSEGQAVKPTTTIAKFQSLGSSMAMTRKVLRFGRPIGITMDVIRTIKDLVDGKVLNPPKAILSALSSICLELFFLFDHYLYIERIGLADNPQLKARCDYLSNFFWLWECIFGIVKNVVAYLEVCQTGSKEQIAKRRKQLLIDTLRNLLDIPIAIGFMKDGSVSSEMMGQLGVITSLIGIYQIWK